MEGKTENNCLSFRTKWDTEIITVVEKKKQKKKNKQTKPVVSLATFVASQVLMYGIPS